MAVNNTTLAQAVYLQGSNDFQQRIPEPSISGISSTMQALFQPMNRKYLNEFMDILINKVAFTVVRGKRWENPLAVFEKRRIDYGSTIEEVALKWIRAHSYRDDWGDREDDITNLLKVNRPDGSVAYHSINRRDTYPISINEIELQEAFKSEQGLNELVARIMELPANSDAYDTYRIMLELIGMYEANWGFYKVNLTGEPTDEATGKEFLTKLRAIAGRLAFPSSLYNALTVQDIPTFANPSELVLLTTPDVQAVLDVETLASVFNLDKADIRYRTIIVDEFPIPGAVALLTTEDFFVVHDKTYMTTSFFNPQTLTTNYYLHHISVNSVSPFVPAVLFTTGVDTNVPVVTQEVENLDIDAEGDVEDVYPGMKLQLYPKLVGELSGQPQGNLRVAPDAVTYELVAIEERLNAEPRPLTLTPFTYVDRFGVLHVADDMPISSPIGTDIPVRDPNIVLMVGMRSAYLNPSGETPDNLANGIGFNVISYEEFKAKYL